MDRRKCYRSSVGNIGPMVVLYRRSLHHLYCSRQRDDHIDLVIIYNSVMKYDMTTTKNLNALIELNIKLNPMYLNCMN